MAQPPAQKHAHDSTCITAVENEPALVEEKEFFKEISPFGGIFPHVKCSTAHDSAQESPEGQILQHGGVDPLASGQPDDKPISSKEGEQEHQPEAVDRHAVVGTGQRDAEQDLIHGTPHP